MKSSLVSVGLSMMFAIGSGIAQQPAPVRVESGVLQGTSGDGLTIFRGIPFAAPPVGDFRWRPPQPAAEWEGVRQAAKFAPGPIQGGIQTIMMEMLAYSRPGVLEVLPALPPSLVKGSINGMLARTFARIDTLAWDMEARTVDVTITSVRKQDITLIARHGIEEISAPAGVLAEAFRQGMADCDLHLPEKKPVEIHLKIGRHEPLEWVDQVM